MCIIQPVQPEYYFPQCKALNLTFLSLNQVANQWQINQKQHQTFSWCIISSTCQRIQSFLLISGLKMQNNEIRDYATKWGHVIAMAYYIRLFELVCIVCISIYCTFSIFDFTLQFQSDESTESNVKHFLHSLFDWIAKEFRLFCSF